MIHQYSLKVRIDKYEHKYVEKQYVLKASCGVGNIIFINDLVRVLRDNMPKGDRFTMYDKGVQDTLKSLLIMLGEGDEVKTEVEGVIMHPAK